MLKFFKSFSKSTRDKYRLSLITKEYNNLEKLRKKLLKFKYDNPQNEYKQTIIAQSKVLRENYSNLMKLVEGYNLEDQFSEIFGRLWFQKTKIKDYFLLNFDTLERGLQYEFSVIKHYDLLKLSKLNNYNLSTHKMIKLKSEIKKRIIKDIKNIKIIKDCSFYKFDEQKLIDYTLNSFENSIYQVDTSLIEVFYFLVDLKAKEPKDDNVIMGEKKLVKIPRGYDEMIELFNFKKYDFYTTI